METDSKNENEWIFPELDGLNHSDELVTPLHEEIDSSSESMLDEPLASEIPAKKEPVIDTELLNLKAEYEDKINLLNNIVTKLEHPLLNINDQVITIIRSIIKKCVKHLIHVELKEEPLLIAEVINEMVAYMQDKSEMVTISLSEIDYNRLNASDHKASKLIIIDNSLKEGDVVVKSNYSEVRSILEERVDKMIGIKHD